MKTLSDQITQTRVIVVLAVIWLFALLSQQNIGALLADYGLFSFLGILGAIFANATGAGGGVVFVPFFNYLNFDPEAIIATSFAIQCCGMTAGAITWLRHSRQYHASDEQWKVLSKGLLLTAPPAVVGIWLAQYGVSVVPALAVLQGNLEYLHLGFGIFSIFLALAIYASVLLINRQAARVIFIRADTVLLPVVGLLGGVITAWLSVGVGELVAVYLIMRGFNVTMSIALAVILSAISVWSAISYHLMVSHAIVWQVVLFAGAGAVLGGIIARYVVLAFSPRHLKLFFGTWVLLLGVTGLPVF